MTKPAGANCNLRCSYCYYLEKHNLYPDSPYKMSDELLEKFIKEYIKSQDLKVVSFVWQGGEPCLAGLEFYEKAVFFQRKHAGTKQIANAFQTNGTLIDENWAAFFSKNNFLVGVSIDGPEHIHNHYRKNVSGKGSFSEVMRGIQWLRQYNVQFNTLTVVNDVTSQYPLEIYNFLKSTGSTFMQFLPAVEQETESTTNNLLKLVSPDFKGTANLTLWSVIPGDYSNFLISVFDEWIKQDVGRYFIQIFDATLANWAGEDPGLCAFQKTCGDAGVIEKNGDVYSCDHFVYPENYLGNLYKSSLNKIMDSARQNEFGLNKHYNLPEKCLHCDYVFACHGGCPKNRIVETEEEGKRLNYLCLDYQKFFIHVTPYMNFMVKELQNERPPANVMEWIKTKNPTHTR